MTSRPRAEDLQRYEPEGGMLSNAVAAHGFVSCVSLADDVLLDIAGQTRQTLAYIDHCLKAAGTDRGHLVQVTIWLSDIRHREAMNAVWTEWLGDAPPPARACVEAKLGNPRYLIEITALAALKSHPAA